MKRPDVRESTSRAGKLRVDEEMPIMAAAGEPDRSALVEIYRRMILIKTNDERIRARFFVEGVRLTRKIVRDFCASNAKP